MMHSFRPAVLTLLCVCYSLGAAQAQGRFSSQSEEIKTLASFVQAGVYHCFDKLTVDIKPRSDHLGYIDLTFKGITHHMLPVPSNSGALRLETQAGGFFWLQLSAKNMLFSKQGSRVADDCHLKNAASETLAAQTLGIGVTDLPTAPPSPAPTAAEQKQLVD